MTDEPPPYSDDEAPTGDNVTPIRDARTNHPAERAYLGGILGNPAHAAQALEHIDSDDLDVPLHEQIYNAITQVVAQGIEPDPIAVEAHLRRSGVHTKNGSMAVFLFDLVQQAPSAALVSGNEYYAQLIRDAALLRRFATTGTRISALVQTATPENLHRVASDALHELDQAVARSSGHAGLLHTDLSWLLNGQPPVVEPPTYVHRAAGGALFYPGRVNGLYGDPESAKSWIAQVGIVEALTAGQPAGFIDVDHNGPALTTERLMLLGATPEQLANPDRFRYHQPEDGPELLNTIHQWATWKPAYVVLDSIGEMMPMLGAKSVDNDELSAALRNLTQPFIKAGTCVVTIDHLPKSPEARSSGYAIGGTAKKRAIDGTLIHAEAKTPPAPGGIGRIILRIEKDRPGRLREQCAGKYIGTFNLDSTNPGITTTVIANESAITDTGAFRPTGVMESVSRYVEEHDQATFRDIKTAVAGKDTTIRAAIQSLRDEGFLSTLPGRNNSTIHHSIGRYREDEDDQA